MSYKIYSKRVSRLRHGRRIAAPSANSNVSSSAVPRGRGLRTPRVSPLIPSKSARARTRVHLCKSITVINSSVFNEPPVISSPRRLRARSHVPLEKPRFPKAFVACRGRLPGTVDLSLSLSLSTNDHRNLAFSSASSRHVNLISVPRARAGARSADRVNLERFPPSRSMMEPQHPSRDEATCAGHSETGTRIIARITAIA